MSPGRLTTPWAWTLPGGQGLDSPGGLGLGLPGLGPLGGPGSGLPGFGLSGGPGSGSGVELSALLFVSTWPTVSKTPATSWPTVGSTLVAARLMSPRISSYSTNPCPLLGASILLALASMRIPISPTLLTALSILPVRDATMSFVASYQNIVAFMRLPKVSICRVDE